VLRMRTMVAGGAATAVTAVFAVGGLGGAAGAATVPAKSSAKLRSFHGTVTSVSTSDRTFRLRRASGGTLTFRVNGATVYERVGGLSSLRGKAVEVKGRRADGRWTARKVELEDGDDRGGSDDGANHDAGDDHGGSRSGGSDDGANHDAGDDHGGSRGGGSDDGANHDAGDDHGGHGSDD
jgi:hypothetical protein